MKTFLVALGFSLTFAQFASAAERVALMSEPALSGVFVTTSEWHTSKSFDEVDAVGIAFDSIEEGLRQCRAAGNDLCVVKSEQLVKATQEYDGRRHTQFLTVIKAADSVAGLIKDKVYTGSMSVSSAGDVSTLAGLGASGSSLHSALGNCYAAGNDFCTVLNVSFKEVNSPHSDGYRYTSAEASVRGYKLPLK